MRPVLLVTLLVGCASAPRPTAPDESHRFPVNRAVPVEVAQPNRPERPPARDPERGDSMEWR